MASNNSLGYRLKIYTLVFATVLSIGIVGLMHFEDLTFGDSLYFSIVTLATVGYGDITPKTGPGRALAMIMMIAGITTFLSVMASTTDVFLNRRESEAKKNKLNIIIGVFFSEGGTDLLRFIVKADTNLEALGQAMLVKEGWGLKEFTQGEQAAKAHKGKLDSAKIDFHGLREFLGQKSELYLRLFENPYILEHETFTDLLRAVLHLKEELSHRDDLDTLKGKDLEHLTGDVQRVYGYIVLEWIDYMRYLKDNYPYLFSLARRTNPFDPQAQASLGE